jgi:hypothetical protein
MDVRAATELMQRSKYLFDLLVGAGEQRQRHGGPRIAAVTLSAGNGEHNRQPDRIR